MTRESRLLARVCQAGKFDALELDERSSIPRGTRVALVFVIALFAMMSRDAVAGDDALGPPWQASLSIDQPPLPCDVIAAPAFSVAHELGLPPSEVRRWFERVPGESFDLHEEKANDKRYTRWGGMGRLLAPWSDGAVFELTPYRVEDLSLYVWRGHDGVRLTFYRQRSPYLFAAYGVTRDDNKPRSSHHGVFITSDNGRYQRGRQGAFELRYQAGTLILSRGNMRLLTVPFDGPPKDVFLEGKMRLRAIAMTRRTPMPEDPVADYPVVAGDVQTRLLPWDTQPADYAQFGYNGDGSVRLSTRNEAQAAEKRVAVAWAGIPMKQAGLYEIIVHVRHAQPGTGLFLGNENREPVHCFGFVRDRKTDSMFISYSATGYDNRPPSRIEFEKDVNSRNTPIPFSDGTHWLRFIVSSGVVRVWSSGDGRHWGWATYASSSLFSPGFASFGLYAALQKEHRSIELDHLVVRELSTFTSLADPQLIRRVSAKELMPVVNTDFGTWLHRVIQIQPDDVPFDTWRRACAVCTIRAGAPQDLHETLVTGLLADGLAESSSFEAGLKLLNEAAVLLRLEDYSTSQRWAAALVELAERHSQAAGESAFSLVVPATLRLVTPSAVQASLPSTLMATDMMRLIDSRDWPALYRLLRQIRFWSDRGDPRRRWWDTLYPLSRLIPWAGSFGQSRAPKLDWESLQFSGGLWRHPLVTRLSREGYNVMAEFKSAVRDDQFEDACRVIAQAASADILGLLPDTEDSDLLVSFPRAVAMAMQEQPVLRRTMIDQFGAIGALRVKDAMQRHDVEAIEGATIQFFGTDAAADAHLWLGDRALAVGRLGQAIDHYRQAATSDRLADDAAARLQLAAALLGNNIEAAETPSLRLAEQTMSPAQFQALVNELRQAHADDANVAASQSNARGPFQQNGHTAAQTGLIRRIDWPEQSAPSQSAKTSTESTAFAVADTVTLEGRGHFGGAVGQHAERRSSSTHDWIARQIASAVGDKRFYVSNRFQVVAYDTHSARQLWSEDLHGDQGEAHSLLHVPMQPLLDGDRLFVRRLTKSGVELACLDSVTGRLLWRNRPPDQVISDPVFVAGQLVALLQQGGSQGAVQIDVAHFHTQTGHVLKRQRLCRVDASNGVTEAASLSVVDGHLVATIAGSVAVADSNGAPIWIRRQMAISPRQDTFQVEQSRCRPVVTGGKIVTTQPGTREIVCLELATGRLVWKCVLSDVRSLIGVQENRVVVETRRGLDALDIQTGARLWSRTISDRLDGSLTRLHDAILCCTTTVGQRSIRTPRLLVLSIQTGESLAEYELSSLADKYPKLGPIIAVGDRLFCFTGRGTKQVNRELAEIVPSRDISLVQSGQLTMERWFVRGADRSRDSVATMLPGWYVALRSSPRETGPRDEFRGERNVFVTHAPSRSRNEDDPLPAGLSRLFRWLTVPKDSRLKLKIKVGHDAGIAWRLRVDVGQSEVLRVNVDDRTAANGWAEFAVDLTPFAGRSVGLVVTHEPLTSGKTTFAYWKYLKLVGVLKDGRKITDASAANLPRFVSMAMVN